MKSATLFFITVATISSLGAIDNANAQFFQPRPHVYRVPLIYNGGGERSSENFTNFTRDTLVRVHFLYVRPCDLPYVSASILGDIAKKGDVFDSPKFGNGHCVWIRGDRNQRGNYVGDISFGSLNREAFFKLNPYACVVIEVLQVR